MIVLLQSTFKLILKLANGCSNMLNRSRSLFGVAIGAEEEVVGVELFAVNCELELESSDIWFTGSGFFGFTEGLSLTVSR